MHARALHATVGTEAGESAGAAAGCDILRKTAVGGFAPALARSAETRAGIEERMRPHAHAPTASTPTSAAGSTTRSGRAIRSGRRCATATLRHDRQEKYRDTDSDWTHVPAPWVEHPRA